MGTTPVLELLKLPEFLTHLEEHRSENPELSLLDFIDIHYLHGNVKDDDYEEDMKLPFKEYNGCVTSILMDQPTCLEWQAPCLQYFSLSDYTLLYFNASIWKSLNLNRIWQPPKL